MTQQTDAPVLIVGGGPIGFALALDLGLRGVETILVERDAGTALELLAKAGTLNERTMEICRRWGVADDVANCGFPADHARDNVFLTALNGFHLGTDPLPSAQDRPLAPFAAEILRKCPQHLFDPILARAAIATGKAKVLYSTRFDRLEQDGDGVTVYLSDLKTGKAFTARAGYVVACDGGASTVREQLGIPFEGEDLDNSLSIMVRIPELWKYHDHGKPERFLFVGREGIWSNMTAVDGVELFRFTLLGSKSRLNVDEVDIPAEIRKALGRDDIAFEVVRVVPWWRRQMHAATYLKGRVLLAGDAAHTTSPTGGHGLNTGIGDVDDLGWMLDAMVKGWGGPGLLDAYTLERRAVAIRNCGGSTKNYKAWVKKPGEHILDASPEGDKERRELFEFYAEILAPEWHSQGVGMGYRYEGSPLVIPDGTPEPEDDPSVYVQTARPGHRAPHAWLSDKRSTLDLFGRGFVLLSFSGAPAASSILEAAKSRGAPLELVSVENPDIAALYERKLVLVRPDGMVAWRSDMLPESPADLIDKVRGASL